VHIITRLIVGGAQENTLLTCEGLTARGHDVTLISGPTTGPEGRLVERARAGGYRFIEEPTLVRPVRPACDLRALRRLTRTLRELAPEIVHTHSSKAGILGRFAAARAGVPVIVHTIHGMSFNRTQPTPVRAFYAALERAAARRTDVLITVAGAMIAQSQAAGVRPRGFYQTIYSGMELEPYDPGRYDRHAVRAGWGAGPDAIVVGTIARLFRNKGYEQLIDVIDRLRDEPRLRFVWVGDGAQRAEYEARLARLGLRDRVIVLGLQPPERIAGLIAGFDILAHTSQWEGLPRAVVQALLMRVPAVAFDIDGTPEVVEDNVTGRLIRLNDLDAFAAAVRELAGDPALRRRLGETGRRRCLERFDWRRMVEQIEQAYRDALRSARPAGRVRLSE